MQELQPTRKASLTTSLKPGLNLDEGGAARNWRWTGRCGFIGHVPKGSGTLNHCSFEDPGPCIGGSGTCNGGAHDP